jgi:pyruvate dehydrogenase E2 component (dihydrolipoamide acetyltransferase)
VGQSIEIQVPDIGDFEDVEVVEILASVGDRVDVDDPLVSIESDKATMEIPVGRAGLLTELRVSVGDRVSEGTVIALLEAEASADESEIPEAAVDASSAVTPASNDSVDEAGRPPDDDDVTPGEGGTDESPLANVRQGVGRGPRPERVRQMSAAARNPIPDRSDLPHASPLVRRYARELGVPVGETDGTGPHGRVLVEDVQRVVRERFASDEPVQSGTRGLPDGSGSGIPSLPEIDHSAFGPVYEESLSRIQRVSGPALRRSWLNVPHVTQHDEADVTELERFRRDRREAAAERGLRLSPLLFVMKAVVGVLRAFPKFRSALTVDGRGLVVKDYYHLGIAVDTDQGLVVPVIRDVDRKGIFELAGEIAETAERARAGRLEPSDLAGAVFTISSLGGIGGTAFTPIVNAPEVAILGLSETNIAPRWRGLHPLDPAPGESGTAEAPGLSKGERGHFEPRLVLPLSLSYDHRVIDGAEAVRFTTRLAHVLGDPRRLLL